MESIPRDVAEAVRVAADAARGYPGSLGDVRRRAGRRRGRRIALTAAVVTVLATAGVGVAVQRTVADPAPVATTPPVEERLILKQAIGVYLSPDSRRTKLRDGTIGELLPDGTLITHQVPGWPFIRHEPLPGGGFVMIGTGPSHTDHVLVVTDAGGRELIRRGVGRPNEEVRLVTVTATTVYLLRWAGVVAHDLATGEERSVIAMRAMDLQLGDAILGSIDVAGARVAVPRESDPCGIGVYDDPAGREYTKVRVDDEDCEKLTDFQLSPDGSMLAVVYRSRSLVAGIAVIRIADGAIVARRSGAVVEPHRTATEPRPGIDHPVVALAWRDDHTLRGVSYLNGGADDYELIPYTITF